MACVCAGCWVSGVSVVCVCVCCMSVKIVRSVCWCVLSGGEIFGGVFGGSRNM